MLAVHGGIRAGNRASPNPCEGSGITAALFTRQAHLGVQGLHTGAGLIADASTVMPDIGGQAMESAPALRSADLPSVIRIHRRAIDPFRSDFEIALVQDNRNGIQVGSVRGKSQSARF